MKRAYFDASAIAKLVREERESRALSAFLEDPMEATTSAISEVEVARTLRRYGIPAADVTEVLRSFVVVALDERIRQRAGAIDPVSLPSVEAVHLATAMAVGTTGLQVVTYDERLAAAARANGLAVVQPR